MKARWALIIIVLAFSLYQMLPLNEKVRLGLDLQGGMHVVLGVDTEAAIKSKFDAVTFQLRKELQKEKVQFSYVQLAPPYGVKVGYATDKADIRKLVEDTAAMFGLKPVSNSADGQVFSLSNADIESIRTSAVLQSIEVVRNRVDGIGVAEPVIQKQGKNQILLQLPGITDPDRAINLIGQTAQLKFYIVNTDVTQENVDAGRIPYDSMLLYQKMPNTSGGVSKIPVVVKRNALMGGENLMDASVRYSQSGEPYVGFDLDPVGAKIFEDITKANQGKYLAIVLDDMVYSAPQIKEPIPGGRGQITGRFSMEDARDLAIVLRAGSMPAPITIEENRTVGPSLGLDSIKSSVNASIIGLSIICIFMIIYYKVSGMIANIGLVCNFIILLGALCWIKATLTLPGIAGIILTLGIAVDSNVLIFERVREELRTGRSVLNAFEIGYQKAFTTIVDANVTSLIAALVLFQFGTGPVKGFAVTLSLGLIASMFTAVFITKTVFVTFIVSQNSKSISI